jgi:hypothetical protein
MSIGATTLAGDPGQNHEQSQDQNQDQHQPTNINRKRAKNALEAGGYGELAARCVEAWGLSGLFIKQMLF